MERHKKKKKETKRKLRGELIEAVGTSFRSLNFRLYPKGRGELFRNHKQGANRIGCSFEEEERCLLNTFCMPDPTLGGLKHIIKLRGVTK